MLLKIKCEYCDNEKLEKTNCTTTFYCPSCDYEISIHECEIEEVKVSEFADYLIENASYAFENQDRELLEKALKQY